MLYIGDAEPPVTWVFDLWNQYFVKPAPCNVIRNPFCYETFSKITLCDTTINQSPSSCQCKEANLDQSNNPSCKIVAAHGKCIWYRNTLSTWNNRSKETTKHNKQTSANQMPFMDLMHASSMDSNTTRIRPTTPLSILQFLCFKSKNSTQTKLQTPYERLLSHNSVSE